MRNLYFLLPGTTSPFGGGGLWAEMKTVNLASQICSAQIVTYRQKELKAVSGHSVASVSSQVMLDRLFLKLVMFWSEKSEKV